MYIRSEFSFLRTSSFLSFLALCMCHLLRLTLKLFHKPQPNKKRRNTSKQKDARLILLFIKCYGCSLPSSKMGDTLSSVWFLFYVCLFFPQLILDFWKNISNSIYSTKVHHDKCICPLLFNIWFKKKCEGFQIVFAQASVLFKSSWYVHPQWF